jgi:hypothetical protein
MAKVDIKRISAATLHATTNPRFDVYQISFFNGLGLFMIYDNYIEAIINTPNYCSSVEDDHDSNIYASMTTDETGILLTDLFKNNRMGPNGEKLTLEEIFEIYQ